MNKIVKTISALSIASLIALSTACTNTGVNTESHENLDLNKHLTVVNPAVNQSGSGI